MTEFGSGVVVCLAKFSEHLSNRFRERFEPPSENAYATEWIEVWMNGASDHFYGLDRNKAPQSLIDLADLTLDIGHGFTGKTYTKETVEKIYEMWAQACLDVDQMLGVTDGDWGEW